MNVQEVQVPKGFIEKPGENPARSRHCVREFQSMMSLEKSGKAL